MMYGPLAPAGDEDFLLTRVTSGLERSSCYAGTPVRGLPAGCNDGWIRELEDAAYTVVRKCDG